MCGRYALGIRATFVRYQLQQQGMPVDDAPADEDARETYNFPPGSFGLVYRAEVPDYGLRNETDAPIDNGQTEGDPEVDNVEVSTQPTMFKYELKVMKWGLIPFWTKRAPEYSSTMRTINCRDDSLLENRGMWNTMKQKKRCIVIAQGFYEWLKKGPGGKEKIPHFTKRRDGNLMCFAGLWDCVKYEDAEEKLYTYTIITTDSNKQLSFLHDRMPVILEPNSASMKLWLDPTQTTWTESLQSMLKPYEGELDCYPVSKEVGKVGNNSPDFIVPVDSKENKNNIANFFGNATKASSAKSDSKQNVVNNQPNDRGIANNELGLSPEASVLKRKNIDDNPQKPLKIQKVLPSPIKSHPPSKTVSSKKNHNAISNANSTLKASPTKDLDAGTQRITNFFSK